MKASLFQKAGKIRDLVELKNGGYQFFIDDGFETTEFFMEDPELRRRLIEYQDLAESDIQNSMDAIRILKDAAENKDTRVAVSNNSAGWVASQITMILVLCRSLALCFLVIHSQR